MLLITHAKWLIDVINKIYSERFTGHIQINFFAGSITNINKTESLKPTE